MVKSTKQQAINWINQSVGKGYDFDGAYGQQCFDLVNAYAFANWGVSFRGAGAIDLQNTGVVGGFTKVSKPEVGDIFVQKNIYGPYGHTGIVTGVTSQGVNVIDQNGTGRLDNVTRRYFNFSDSKGTMVCYLRPPYANATQPAPNKPTLIKENATFISNTNELRIRRAPSLTGEVAGVLNKGDRIVYDGKISADGYRWVHYIGASGKDCYVAVRRLSDNVLFGQII